VFAAVITVCHSPIMSELSIESEHLPTRIAGGRSKWALVNVSIASGLLITAACVDFSLRLSYYVFATLTFLFASLSIGLFLAGWLRSSARALWLSVLVQMMQMIFSFVSLSIIAYFQVAHPSIDKITRRLCDRCHDSSAGLRLFSTSECTTICASADSLANWSEWLDTRTSLVAGASIPILLGIYHSRMLMVEEYEKIKAGEEKKNADVSVSNDSFGKPKIHKKVMAFEDLGSKRNTGWARKRATAAFPQTMDLSSLQRRTSGSSKN
jgi:hypothetical protein